MNTERKPWNPVESLPRDELRKLQWSRLQPQLAYNYEHSSFYRKRFDDLGTKPEDIRSWEDFQQIPTMNKDLHRRAQEESIEQFGHPYGTLACAPTEDFLMINATSGTTGMPTFYTSTKHDLAVVNELQARKFWRLGLRPGDRVVHGFSLSLFVGGVPMTEAMKNYGLCVIPVGAEAGSHRLLETAALTRPRALTCTPSYAEYLVEKAPETLGHSIDELGIEILMCGGEPGVGLPEVRQRLETAYGARIYDFIGATHTFHGVSCDLEKYQGLHLVSEDHCILELLDPVTKQVMEIEDGVIGEMVFTYLDFRGTPLLRYAIGDMLQVFTEPCACGWPGMRFKIIGRSDDMLIVKGVNVFPGAIRNVVSQFSPRTTGHMRVVLDQPGHSVKPPLRLTVEHGDDVESSAQGRLKAELETMMHDKLKVRPEIELVPNGTLERSSHKTKLIEIRSRHEAGGQSMNWVLPKIKEINLICMSGQGSVQTMEIMTKAFYEQDQQHVGSVVYPGNRSRSTPVICYMKVSDRPIASTATNSKPTEVIVFWDGLLRVAEKNGHEAVTDAIARLRNGTLIVNTARAPEEIDLPFEFTGTLATVDASGIAAARLNRNPPPVGVTLIGAYAAVTGALDMEVMERLVRERFSHAVAEANIAAAHEAHDSVKVLRDVVGKGTWAGSNARQLAPEELPEWFRLEKPPMRGYREGSVNIWRSKIPVCDDGKCLCKKTCISEAMCPDGTGFIVRDGFQGYRIDVDYCRGCGNCAEVCVYDAISMVEEGEALWTHSDYDKISVAPHRHRAKG